MTTLKNTTKAGQAIINDYNRTIRNGRTGYAIKGTEQFKTLMIPFEIVQMSA